jgi:hypothetical protein
MAALFAAGAAAAPFLPNDDAQVLERLPGRTAPQFRELKSLQVAAAQAPGDLTRAVALATAYVRASRLEGDPRFLGYAEGALAPWWKDPAALTRVLVLRATILQSSHQFDAAIADLNTVLHREPRNAQALLTRATVLTVQGKYARGARRLQPDVRHRTGNLRGDLRGRDRQHDRQGRSRLRIPAARFAQLAAHRRRRTRLGKRSGRDRAPPRGSAAERHFHAALGAGDRDIYLLGAYCDWLSTTGAQPR